MGAREATAEGEKLRPSGPAVVAAPATDSSTLRYATSFFLSHRELLAPFGRGGESVFFPSQLQTTMVRRGRMPRCLSSPRERVSSIMEAVPLEGSTPRRPRRRDDCRAGPIRREATAANAALDHRVRLHAGVMSTFTRTLTAPAKRYVMGKRPCQSLGASGPFIFSRSGLASRHERGSAGIFGTASAHLPARMCFAPGTMPNGRGGIAGNDVIVSDRAALDMTLGPHGPWGKLFLSCSHLPRDRNK